MLTLSGRLLEDNKQKGFFLYILCCLVIGINFSRPSFLKIPYPLRQNCCRLTTSGRKGLKSKMLVTDQWRNVRNIASEESIGMSARSYLIVNLECNRSSNLLIWRRRNKWFLWKFLISVIDDIHFSDWHCWVASTLRLFDELINHEIKWNSFSLLIFSFPLQALRQEYMTMLQLHLSFTSGNLLSVL